MSLFVCFSNFYFYYYAGSFAGECKPINVVALAMLFFRQYYISFFSFSILFKLYGSAEISKFSKFLIITYLIINIPDVLLNKTNRGVSQFIQ